MYDHFQYYISWHQNKFSWCTIENDHSFEWNEDRVTVFLKWTDFMYKFSYQCNKQKILDKAIVCTSKSLNKVLTFDWQVSFYEGIHPPERERCISVVSGRKRFVSAFLDRRETSRDSLCPEKKREKIYNYSFHLTVVLRYESYCEDKVLLQCWQGTIHSYIT